MPSSPDEFDALEKILAQRRGRANAITQGDIAAALGTTVRQVQQLLQTRRHDFPWPVVGGDRGMWVATTAEDLNHELLSRRSRIRSIATVSRDIRLVARRCGFIFEGKKFVDPPRQLELFVPNSVAQKHLSEKPYIP